MDLISFNEWIKKFPEISIATSSDSESILELFKLTPMKGEQLALYYDRSPDYFSFLKCHSPNFFVLILKDENKTKATGTLIIRPGIIKGNRCWVGYLGDLRVSDPKKWGRYWRTFYKSLMAELLTIKEFKGAIHWQTCLLSDNHQAKKALIGQRSLGYVPYSFYEMNNLIMRKPFKTKSQIEVITAKSTDMPQIKLFLKEQYKKRDFGFVFDEDYDELNFRLNSWPEISPRSLLVVKDQNKIIGFTLLWNPSRVKKIIIKKISWDLKISGSLLRMITPWPRENEELVCLYPTLFQISDELNSLQSVQVAEALLNEALKRRKEFGAHVVSIASFKKESWTDALKNFITIKKELQLLTVDPEERARNDYSFYSSPGFDIALV